MGNLLGRNGKREELGRGEPPPRVTMPEIEEDRREAANKRRAQLQRVLHGLQETTNIMHRVMTDMMDRGDSVELTLEKSDELVESSHLFRRTASPWYSRCCLDVKQALRFYRAKTHQFIARQRSWLCGRSEGAV